jgi:hypothetical protein
VPLVHEAEILRAMSAVVICADSLRADVIHPLGAATFAANGDGIDELLAHDRRRVPRAMASGGEVERLVRGPRNQRITTTA